MSKDFLWELESLRRRFGVEGDDFRAAVKQLTLKRAEQSRKIEVDPDRETVGAAC